jgi:hypothetical protein
LRPVTTGFYVKSCVCRTQDMTVKERMLLPFSMVWINKNSRASPAPAVFSRLNEVSVEDND